jgi:phosphoribosyl 1,2-cyclic phosphodiesterase
MRHALEDGMEIYTSKGTAEAVGEKKGFAGVESHYRMNIAKAGKQFRIGTWTIMPFEAPHDVREMLCFLLHSDNGEKLLFITDSGYVVPRFEGLTHIMVEANHCADILAERNASAGSRKKLGQRVRRNHMSLDTLIDFLKANDLSQCQEIWLLHLSDQNADEARMIREVQEQTGIPTRAAE